MQVRLASGAKQMQLTLRATRLTPHGASPLGASNACLVGENPTLIRPGIVGMRGSMVIRTTTDYHHARYRVTPPYPTLPTSRALHFLSPECFI